MRSGCWIWLCSGPGVVPSLPEPASPNSARMVKTWSVFSSGNSTAAPVANVTVAPPSGCSLSFALPLLQHRQRLGAQPRLLGRLRAGPVVGAMARPDDARASAGLLACAGAVTARAQLTAATPVRAAMVRGLTGPPDERVRPPCRWAGNRKPRQGPPQQASLPECSPAWRRQVRSSCTTPGHPADAPGPRGANSPGARRRAVGQVSGSGPSPAARRHRRWSSTTVSEVPVPATLVEFHGFAELQ